MNNRSISPKGGFPKPLNNGDRLLKKFPDLAKPIDGGWKLTVRLARSGDCPVTALVELLQDQQQVGGELVVLASQTFYPTPTPTDYSFDITEAELWKAARGRCHLSELLLRVTASSSCVENCCCSETPIPESLTVEFFSDGNSLGTANLIYDGSDWTGSHSFCGDTDVSIRLRCGGGLPECEWTLVTSNGFSSVSMVSTCDPFKQVYEGAIAGICYGTTVTAIITP